MGWCTYQWKAEFGEGKKDGWWKMFKYWGEKCRVTCRETGFTLRDFDVSRSVLPSFEMGLKNSGRVLRCLAFRELLS